MVKNIVLALIALIVIAGGVYLYMSNSSETEVVPETVEVDDTPVGEENTNEIVIPDENEEDEEEDETEPQEVIGTSVNGADIVAHHFGTGEEEVLFVGGVHSAFAPNTVDVAQELIDALEGGDIDVPENLMVTVIPNLNPDAEGQPNTRAARFNASDVDLNRNFDCEWNAEAVWRDQSVSGGDAAFSEPETAAIQTYVADHSVAAAVVYYAADGGVYASNCGGELDPDIAALTSTYAEASGYTANDEFDAYAISGDMTNWFAKEGIPSIGVLLSDYTSPEWTANRAGIEAVLTSLAE